MNRYPCHRRRASLLVDDPRRVLLKVDRPRAIDCWIDYFGDRAPLEPSTGLDQIPVPAKNSIRPTVTEFGRHGDTLMDRLRRSPHPFTTGSRDDPRPRCLGPR